MHTYLQTPRIRWSTLSPAYPWAQSARWSEAGRSHAAPYSALTVKLTSHRVQELHEQVPPAAVHSSRVHSAAVRPCSTWLNVSQVYTPQSCVPIILKSRILLTHLHRWGPFHDRACSDRAQRPSRLQRQSYCEFLNSIYRADATQLRNASLPS